MKTKNSTNTAPMKDLQMDFNVNGGHRLVRYPEDMNVLKRDGKYMEQDEKDVGPDGKDLEPDGNVMELKDDPPDEGLSFFMAANGGHRLVRYPEEMKLLKPDERYTEPDRKDMEPDGKVMELKGDLPDGSLSLYMGVNGGHRLVRYPKELKLMKPDGKYMEPDGKDMEPDEKDMEPDGKVMELKSDLPDGGWAWIVVFGSFMCNVVLDGIGFSYGIRLIPLLEHFDSSRSIISNGGSLMFGFYLLSSPISALLINKYGCRVVCVMGCIIGALGIGLSALSPNVTFLMITYGVIGGYGLGTMYLPSMVVISDYFDKKRGLATGIADSGSGVGILVFAPLTASLVQNYGWEGTHIAFGAFCLVSVLFAAIMGPLNFKSKKIEKDEKTGENGTTVQDVHESTAELLEPKKSKDWKSNLKAVVDALNLSILINPMFLIVGMANLVSSLGIFVPYFYLPDLVVERNFTREESSYLVSAMGISNTFGRIGTCWISDIPMINSLWSCVMALLITGVTLIVVPFCKSYVEFMVVSILFGFFSAALQMNPVIMVDLLGVENLSLALGYVMIFRGVGVFSGPPIAGLGYDGTKSYDVPFYVAGGLIVLSSLVLLFAAVFQKPRPKMENSNGVKNIRGE